MCVFEKLLSLKLPNLIVPKYQLKGIHIYDALFSLGYVQQDPIQNKTTVNG